MSSALTKYDDKELKKAEDDAVLVWGASAAPPAVRAQIARLTLAYGLDPFLKHIEILGGRPYITHAGLLHYALNIEKRMVVKSVEPLSAEDRERFKDEIKPGEIWRKATIAVYMGEHFGVVEMCGYSKAGGPEESNAVAKGFHKYAIAEKRALNRIVRTAFSIAVPSVEEMGAEQFDLPMGDQPAPQQSARTSRVEAKLRKIDPKEAPAQGETIPAEATKTEDVTPPPQEPSPEAAPQAGDVTQAPEAPSDLAAARALLEQQLAEKLNTARRMIFKKKVLGDRKPDALTLEDVQMALQMLNSKAWAGGDGQ